VKILAVISQKGGVGKTTIATNLAVIAEQHGLATVLFDLDPQASATRWKDARGEAPPDVVAAQAPRLAALLGEASKQGCDLAIIDSAPNADSAALAAAKAADAILIPCRPSAFDLARIIHEKCAIKAKPLISFTTMRMGCLMKFFAMKSLAQVFGGLGRFRAVR